MANMGPAGTHPRGTGTPPRSADRRLLGAVDAIYRSILDPDALDEAAAAAAAALDARALSILHLTTDSMPLRAANRGLSGETVDDYLNNWLHGDPLMDGALGRGLNSVVTPERLLGERGYRDLPVFEAFYRPHDLVHQAALFQRVQSGWLCGISFQRSASDPPIPPADQQRLACLGRHIARAFELALRMHVADASARGADAVLQACGLATVVCTAEARLLWANAGGEAYLRAGTLRLQAATGALRFRDPDAEAALRMALRRARQGDLGPVEFPIAENDSAHASWCIVIPVHEPATHTSPHAPAVALVLQRRGTGVGVDPQRLVRRLGLSPAEGDVLAGLMQGKDLPAIAARRGSALETIRGYVKSARRKLHCHSQAALVSAGWRALAVIPEFANRPPQSPGTG